ncbi:MAG: helix-turn-helix domain-containing protein [Hyphomicrobiales bacterium]|nr:helix-turn-helix domain-containing protein [Hyphomicrobiales bacterium]
MSEVGSQIGGRIKALRKDRGWTLQELGRRCGVSISALSKIENAQVTASFDTMLKIAGGLDITFETLLGQGTASPVGRLVTNRKGEGVHFETDGYVYEVMSSELRRKRIIPLHMQVKARNIGEIDTWSSHDGEEFIYVLKGPIELHTEFYEPVRLETGDSAYFDSQMRHTFVNLGRGSAEMLSICYSSGLLFPDPGEAAEGNKDRPMVKVTG